MFVELTPGQEWYQKASQLMWAIKRRNKSLVPEDSELAEVWQYYQNGHPEAKEILIEVYWPLVQRVTAKMHRNLPAHVEREEVASWGVLGLIRALERFDFSRQVQFETYAVASIRSVVLDELRRLDWAPRSLRRRQRDIAEAREKLEALSSRVPTHEEIGAFLGLTGIEVRKALAATEASYAKSLDEMALSDHWLSNDMGNRGERLEGGVTPHEARITSLIGETAERLIAELSAQEQLILSLYYYHGMTLAEAGKVAGIPESRASQVHSRCVTKIRAELADLLRPADERQMSR